ncbi:hypothetical protein DHL47_03810 [Streptococcus panodentis]|uniref:Uncharacterized protein n=1 Tax=Streptococcus panodentis TaxID=1581472 RepID=A0ABS5AV83_9STRE|nr:hypothetical protein [Streptococcus panodentis]
MQYNDFISSFSLSFITLSARLAPTVQKNCWRLEIKAVGQTPMMAAPSPAKGSIFDKIPYKN